LILLALLLGQAVAAPAFAVAEVCAEACANDGADGRCAPNCDDCACCTHAARPIGAVPESSGAPACGTMSLAAEPGGNAPGGAPRDVFHVPRTRPA
jgi:hypothetical protein